MAILNNNPLIGASGNQGGYNLTNSLRFRRSASAWLNRTPGSAGNRKTFTISFWFKRGNLGVDQKFLSAYSADSDNGNMDFRLTSGDILYWGPWSTGMTTTAVFRDPSAWYHVVLTIDTTQATGANRHRIYVNGVEYTFSGTPVTQNTDLAWNNTIAHNIGRNARTSGDYFDGYMEEFYSIDGQALTPSSFGETDTITGVWKPKRYSGTYGTNGFYLNFTDIALTSGSNTGLGRDFSGNGNFWNTNNISVTAGTTYDAMSDVPTLTSATVANYCTGNPLDVSVRGSFSNANLTATTLGGGSLNAGSVRLNTFNFTQLPVKWYWESTVTNDGSGRALFGLITNPNIAQNENWTTTGGAFLRADGVTNLTNPGSFTTNDVMMFAYDGNTGRFWIGKNGTWTNSGVPASGTGQNITLTVGTEYWLLFNCNTGGTATAVCHMNFGQRAFVYTPPTGFVRVNTFNLPNSTIVKGNTVMDATLYTGNNTGQTITNAGSFRPDFLWIKVRSNTYDHTLADSVRGVSAFLASNSTAAEGTNSELTSFNSNGFTLGATGSMARNVSGQNYVAWQWQAGSSTVTNTSGSISAQVRANTTAGFSVVTYSGNSTSSATVGHGLGVSPSMVIIKNRSAVTNWVVRHSSLSSTQNVSLNTTDAAYTVSSGTANGGVGAFTSTTFGFISGTTGLLSSNQTSNNYVAYCWAAIPGFSAFGSYTGNGSTDGPFIYLGFRPKWVLIKRTDSSTSGNWSLLDSSINTYNEAQKILTPNTADSESTQNYLDLLSNGFKVRYAAANQQINTNGGSYIYAAFAENPFKNALAR